MAVPTANGAGSALASAVLNPVPEPEREETEQRGTATEIGRVLPVERGGVAAGPFRGVVLFGTGVPAPLAAPPHHPSLGAESVAVAEEAAAEHGAEDSEAALARRVA